MADDVPTPEQMVPSLLHAVMWACMFGGVDAVIAGRPWPVWAGAFGLSLISHAVGIKWLQIKPKVSPRVASIVERLASNRLYYRAIYSLTVIVTVIVLIVGLISIYNHYHGQTRKPRLSSQPATPLAENAKTFDSVSFTTERTVPITSGPKVLLEYSWKRGQTDTGITLLNDGTEAALNLEFWDIQRGNWRIKFPSIPILKKGERIKVRPTELEQLSAPKYTRPYTKKYPLFALFLQKLSQDKAIPDSVDPIDVTVNVSYRSASTSDKLRSLNVVNYSRRERSAQAKFLACGKAEPKP